MATKIEPKVVDLEADLSGAQRKFKELAPDCSVAKRAAGIPQLAPQEKQISILHHELEETLLCINLARKGQHAVRDASVKSNIGQAIVNYEKLEEKLRHERLQLVELDCLNYLAKKNVIDFLKMVPSDADELSMLENAYNSLRRMENRLDLATKRFCIVNTDNKRVREEIDRLLVERHSFNIQWKRVITKLMKGKLYLMDIFEIATNTFADRDEWSRKLNTLKWKGLYGLNKDIYEMQLCDGELNHLAKLEEFLRVKGTRRICEADRIEEMKIAEEKAICEEEIARHDALLDEIFAYDGSENLPTIFKHFRSLETLNLSLYVLLCEVLQQSVFLTKDVDTMRQKIVDQEDMNAGRRDNQDKRVANLKIELSEQRQRTQDLREKNHAAEATILKILQGIEDIVKMGQCDLTPLMSLLGNHKHVNKWNGHKFLRLLELEIKSLIHMVYGNAKPAEPVPKPTKQRRKAPAEGTHHKKAISDPHVVTLRPNSIETLVPYQPCAYCVEDFIMNMVFETPAVPADKDFIDKIFHLQEVNTRFGIFTLTIPEKRHAYRGMYRD